MQSNKYSPWLAKSPLLMPEMGQSLQRWQLHHCQLLQRCIAQGTATPPWQDASPNRAEPHSCSGWGRAHAGSPALPMPTACCPEHSGGAQCSLDQPVPCLCPACAAPLLGLPAPRLCCLNPDCPTHATLLPMLLRCLPCWGCSHHPAPHTLPVAQFTLAVLLPCLPRGSQGAPHSLLFPHTP